jgi:hypothetical protein
MPQDVKKGVWLNLPKRKCDNCGTLYKPKRPLLEGQRGFCCDAHRKEYHQHGGAYTKLKPFIEKEIARRVREELRDLRERVESLEAGAVPKRYHA